MAMFDRSDGNGNEMLSLAEFDLLVVREFPTFNNKPALMRAYKAADKDETGYVMKDEFPFFVRYPGVLQQHSRPRPHLRIPRRGSIPASGGAKPNDGRRHSTRTHSAAVGGNRSRSVPCPSVPETPQTCFGLQLDFQSFNQTGFAFLFERVSQHSHSSRVPPKRYLLVQKLCTEERIERTSGRPSLSGGVRSRPFSRTSTRERVNAAKATTTTEVQTKERKYGNEAPN